MTSPADDIDLKPEKMEEQEGETFHCDLYDMDIVHRIAQEFLPGLASACIDNTTGGLFSSPGSVAVDIRREMIDYLVQQSENFVAESVVLEAGPNEEISKDPYDIISDFIDDFASSKRNFFSRVSTWLLSERREDKIDDFVQEMEINGFWLLNRRETIAQTLLKNVDFKNLYHCNMSIKSLGELAEHKSTCNFRTMTCMNEGCSSRFCAAQKDQHDSICPFKILKCEQNCSESIMRREMDRHCITVCPMKLVKCPFYSVGCHSSIPQSTINLHRSENLSSHLLYILQVVHKEASVDDLKERVEELMKITSVGQLALARDARALTYAIKDLEARLGPLKVGSTGKSTGEVTDSSDGKEEGSGSPIKEAKPEESPSVAMRQTVSSPLKNSGGEESSQENEKLVELPTNDAGEQSESEPPNNGNTVQEDSRESPLEKEREKEDELEKSVEQKASEAVKDEGVTSPVKAEEDSRESPLEKEREKEDELEKSVEQKASEAVKDEGVTSSVKAEEDSKESPLEKEREREDELEKSVEQKASEAVKDEGVTSPVKAEEDAPLPNSKNSVSGEENLKESPTMSKVEAEEEERESAEEEAVKGEESSTALKSEEHIDTGNHVDDENKEAKTAAKSSLNGEPDSSN